MILSLTSRSVDIEDIVDIAHHASKIIMSVYEDDTIWDVQHKADNSPVTVADRKAHDYIATKLMELYPDIPVLSEEGEHASYDVRREWDLFWCVDPLDGTKEFLKKNGQFTVNIGLCQGHEVVAGVVHIPTTREVYYAAKAHGTHYRVYSPGNSVLLEENKLRVNNFAWQAPNLRIIGSRSHQGSLTEKFISQFNTPEIILAGSSLKFCMIAHGKADVYPRLAPTCEWDTCAAQILVEEAGGQVLQLSENGDISDAKVIYNKQNLLNPFFLVIGAVQLPTADTC